VDADGATNRDGPPVRDLLEEAPGGLLLVRGPQTSGTT